MSLKIIKVKEGSRNVQRFMLNLISGTVHGFATRPNLEVPVVKEAFEKSFEQTIAWFNKTLPTEKPS